MTSTGLSVWTYGVLLCVVVGLSLFMEGRFMLRAALALLGNWAAHMAWWYATLDPSPFMFGIIADTFTAVIILARPAGRMQALIGWSLLVQITIHFAYWVNLILHGYVVEAEAKYWAWLDWIALAQLVLAGGWAVGSMRRYFTRGNAPWCRNCPRAHDPASVAHS